MFRISREMQADIKAVASLCGQSVQDWLGAPIEDELRRMAPSPKELRSATAR